MQQTGNARLSKESFGLAKAYYDHSKPGLPVIHLVLGQKGSEAGETHN